MKDLRPVEHYENRRFMKRIFFVIALCLMGVLSGYAQEVVTGTVVDSKNNPIPGARVELEGRSEYCMTDIDGTFRIESPVTVQKVKVSYVGLKTVTKKITPDMVVKLGRGWRDAPENYQWFAGAMIGSAVIGDEYECVGDLGFGFKGGRVKKIGWYVSTFMNPGLFGGEDKMFSAVAGGIFRLWCPLHFYIGFGYGYTSYPSHADYIPSWDEGAYPGMIGSEYFDDIHRSGGGHGALDLGWMFRVKRIGIDLGTTFVLCDDCATGAFRLGVSYFFGN